ncbi:hypothetical protein [cyanobacterium endosymbiont of Rhopalodia gibberula]|uniref:hypothetical protein n=1 Tax=cyanobacterium endosymbiont of Rhopalodia gibberula TaxID=1763363 RepID=UPI000E650710|nr:hypothetical protein [cyanobacterium endosymbiont of Rhopalodia gibberula]
MPNVLYNQLKVTSSGIYSVDSTASGVDRAFISISAVVKEPLATADIDILVEKEKLFMTQRLLQRQL